MFPFSLFSSPYLGLLLLGVVAYYRWKQGSRPTRSFSAVGPLVALLLLGQLLLLLILRLALPGPKASGLSLLLLGGSAYVIHRVYILLERVPTPTSWWAWLPCLIVIDAGGLLTATAAHQPTLLLPAWAGGLTLALGVGALVSVLVWAHQASVSQRVLPLLSVPAGPLPIAAARRAYYRQAKLLQPTLLEYIRWFNALPAAARTAARLAGPAGAWRERALRRSFRHFVLEQRGHRYVDFMAEHLEAEQFVRWVNLLNLAAPAGQADFRLP